MTTTAFAPVTGAAFEETPAHTAIFTAIREGRVNVQVSAVAGSGKTSTIMASLRFLSRDLSVMFVAFNTSIVDELKRRVEAMGLQNVEVRTLNSFGNAAVASKLGGYKAFKVEGRKVNLLVDKLVDNKYVRGTVAKLVKLAKAAGMVADGVPGTRAGLVPFTNEALMDLVEQHDVDLPTYVDRNAVFTYVKNVLRASLLDTRVVDFDDQLLHTFAYDLPVRQFDRVFVDEAQDLSPLQHEVLSRALKADGRMISVGDECQAIYGFRGADSESMAKLAERFAMVKLPLHVSYRCPQSVVAVAQRYVGHIQAHHTAPMGTVDESNRDYRDHVATMKGGDMVVSRFNAPNAEIAYALIKARIPCVLRGRDIGAGLKALVKKLKAATIRDLLVKLAAWEDKEVARAKEQGKDDLAMNVQDKAATIRVFCENADSIAELEQAFDTMFGEADDPSKVVTLSSIHKAKGLEANRVFVVNFGATATRAKKEWMQVQERNLIYVAATRAKNTLVMINVPRRKG